MPNVVVMLPSGCAAAMRLMHATSKPAPHLPRAGLLHGGTTGPAVLLRQTPRTDFMVDVHGGGRPLRYYYSVGPRYQKTQLLALLVHVAKGA